MNTTQAPFMSVADIRQAFLDFFAQRGHTVVASSPLVPMNDPTLMFTNSGMVQFKDVFLGRDTRPYTRATSVQACLRAGGKHNDLENVGYTARHHTFFEMLGNWSFGDYFKKESLVWGWELLTEVYKLPPERLLATVYAEDDEAYDIWTKDIGLPPERVVRIGDNKGGRYKSDNFWMMADTGPCGPCSEVFYDHGPEVPGGPPGSPDEDGDRFIEIWNHVFMQFDMDESGAVTRLPAPCVDTGMGLERIAAILQGVHSNYEIDLFQALIAAAARETGCTDLAAPSLRVIADHIRATSFLIAEGVLPGKDGRNHVLRRIIRRAIRHGYKLGQKKPFFHRLVPDLVQQMGDAWPQLREQQDAVQQALLLEEEIFGQTLENGMALFEGVWAQTQKDTPAGAKPVIGGQHIFTLADTYGFPVDMTADMARELGADMDMAGYEREMDAQRERARAAAHFKMGRQLDYAGDAGEFTGYDHLAGEGATVLALYNEGGDSVPELRAGEAGAVVLDATPFYAESGGQVGDSGCLTAEGARFEVRDTQKIKAGVHGHHGQLAAGSLRVGDKVRAQVDAARRAACARNHSATHLMHKALREVLGSHVQQKGSLVDAEKTRFDFSHHTPMTAAQIADVEQRVNTAILANAATCVQHMAIDDARKSGAMMLFGEKYGETVRVVDIGESRELCGGTHVARSGDIGFFKITAESGIGGGIRRVEATTGTGALAWVQRAEQQLTAAAAALHTPPAELPERVQQTLDHTRALERQIAQLKGQLASAQGGGLAEKAVDVDGIKVLAARVDAPDTAALRQMLDDLRSRLPNAAVLLAAVQADGKVQLAAGCAKDAAARIKAGDIMRFAATQMGGKGGGKPDMAMGGAPSADKLDATLAAVPAWVKEQLG